MKKILIVGIVFVGLFLVFTQVFGALNYERTPTGPYITSPVSTFVSWNELEDIGFTEEDYILYWGVMFDITEGDIFSECVAISTKSNTFITEIPVGTYSDSIWILGSSVSKEECELGEGVLGEMLEEEGFEIILPPPFVEISLNFVTSTLAYIGQAVSGLGPLLYFIIGAPVAFWVIRKIIGLVPKR